MIPPKDWSTFQRQPLLSIWLLLFVSAGKIIKAFWPIILILLFRGPQKGLGSFEQLLILTLVVIPIVAVLEFINFKICIADGQLIVKKGILKKETISIPIDNIQAVNIVQNWLHKIVNLVQVVVDSPGTEKAEIKINLSRSTAESLKSIVINARSDKDEATLEVKEEPALFTLSAKDLLKLGISTNHLETLAILFGFSISFLNNIREVIEGQFYDLIEQSASGLFKSGILFSMYVVSGLLIFSVAVSFLRTVIKYSNFTLTRTAKGLGISSGLINTAEQMISFEKIQYVSWSANWVRKKIPFFMLQYHSIGSAALNKKLKVKIPVPSALLLENLTKLYSPGIDKKQPFLQISKKYIYRTILFQGVIPFAIIGGVSFFFIGVLAAALILIPILVSWSAFLFQRNLRIYYNNELLHLRKGAFGQAEVLIKWHKIQSVKLVQSYYQQRKSMADIKIYTAGGSVVIPYLVLKDAYNLRNYALYKIESTNRSWL